MMLQHLQIVLMTVDEDILYSYTPTINDYDGDTCEIKL